MRALISVYDKTGLVEFARGLVDLGVELVSSGGTSAELERAGVAHREVAQVTGAPEMLGGRVKTLHPRIHGGILADRSRAGHLEELAALDISLIDIVVCNLYPFGSDPSIEMIDIGGPTMVRAAAKNHAHVAVVVDPSEYDALLGELRRSSQVSDATRQRLARAAFAHTAAYDAAIVSWLDDPSGDAVSQPGAVLAPTLHLALERAEELRYGENPHQAAARYRSLGGPVGFWDAVVQHSGRELSYLNLFDAEAAWRLAHELSDLAHSVAVIVKHANACGAALAPDQAAAYERAFEADELSAFGGIVALPGIVDDDLAQRILARPLADVVIAYGYGEGALGRFAERRPNMRTLQALPPGSQAISLRQVDGGFLVQEPDRFVAGRADWHVMTDRCPTEDQWRDVELAWRVCARTSSNAIVLARDGQVVGVGCGQQNRVDAASLAARKAGRRAEGGVGASDAFFPFRDGLDTVVASGVTTVIQPGGSLRDGEVIAAANEHDVAMVFTGERHFRH